MKTLSASWVVSIHKNAYLLPDELQLSTVQSDHSLVDCMHHRGTYFFNDKRAACSTMAPICDVKNGIFLRSTDIKLNLHLPHDI